MKERGRGETEGFEIEMWEKHVHSKFKWNASWKYQRSSRVSIRKLKRKKEKKKKGNEKEYKQV